MEKGTKGDGGKKTSMSKVLSINSLATVENCGKDGHRAGTCWATVSMKPTKQDQGSMGKPASECFCRARESRSTLYVR